MKLNYPGSAIARYRDQTETKCSNMNGVMAASFRCCECGRSRATKGRKKTAAGWRCAECHQAREARRAAA